MYILKRFSGPRFDRMNAIIDGLGDHIASYINLVGSATLPLPEACEAHGLPATACRVEGHPDARLFPATAPMDQAEALIEECTRDLFGFDASYEVNAQPHSATQANQVAFHAVLGGDGRPVVGLAPTDGGHISHSVSLPGSSPFFAFPLTPAGIDYAALATLVRERRPAVIVAGSTSYTRGIEWARLREIADEVDAHVHADLAHVAPFIAAGLHPPAFPFVDSATLDVSKNLRGPNGGILIYRASARARMRRAMFPLVQTSPNAGALLSKAACLSFWTPADVRVHAVSMVRLARILSTRLASTLGEPIFGVTESHLLVFDVTRVAEGGAVAEAALERARILVNRNQVPGDRRSPWDPSGIRLGMAALAILNYSDADAAALGDAISSVLEGNDRHREIVERLLVTYHRPLVSSASARTGPAPTSSPGPGTVR
jgi:glycine hydroxymethyltransferase